MNSEERIQLDKMISQGSVEDVTEDIRKKKHSSKLREELGSITSLLADHAAGTLDLTKQELSNACEYYAPFMYKNYTDLFIRAKNGDLDFEIMGTLIDVLERIEGGEINQHEGAHEVGILLKRLYIDSALKRSSRLDDDDETAEEEKRTEPLNVDYAHFKKRQQQIADGKVRKCAKCGVETPACELIRTKRKKKGEKVCNNCA